MSVKSKHLKGRSGAIRLWVILKALLHQDEVDPIWARHAQGIKRLKAAQIPSFLKQMTGFYSSPSSTCGSCLKCQKVFACRWFEVNFCQELETFMSGTNLMIITFWAHFQVWRSTILIFCDSNGADVKIVLSLLACVAKVTILSFCPF